MEISTLKKIRLVYPGIVALLLVAMFVLEDGFTSIEDFLINPSSIDLEATFPIIFTLLFGTIYYALSVRNIIWKPCINKVVNNINSTLLKITGVDSSITLSKKQKRQLSYVFYDIVDNDNSLSIKSRIVMSNGSILSCSIDTFLFLTVAILFFTIRLIFFDKELGSLFWMIVAIDAVSILVFFPVLKKHMRLSDEQLEIIELNYNKKCHDKIAQIVHCDK